MAATFTLGCGIHNAQKSQIPAITQNKPVKAMYIGPGRTSILVSISQKRIAAQNLMIFITGIINTITARMVTVAGRRFVIIRSLSV